MKSKLRSGRLSSGFDAFGQAEDVNPMNYMNNLSDVMLVLAVGIMLALVIAWDVDIAPEGSKDSELSNAQVELENQQVEVNDEELEPYGTVYRDKDGNFYVLENEK